MTEHIKYVSLDGESRIVPLENYPPGRVEPEEPDWIPGWDEEIAVYLDSGTKLFSINSRGEVYVHDHDCIPEAAVIFFRDVAKIAELQGWTVDRASDRHGGGPE